MLGVNDETELSEALWQSLTLRVELPSKIEAAQLASMRESARPDCQRRYARKAIRSLAITVVGGEYLACQMKDISRIGVGFYSPVNILPKKSLRVWLPNGNTFQLRVTRCRRLADCCYEVGTRFLALSSESST